MVMCVTLYCSRWRLYSDLLFVFDCVQSKSIQCNTLLQRQGLRSLWQLHESTAWKAILKCSSETEQNVLWQTSHNSLCFDSFPPDESTLFSEDFSVLPSFVQVLMDAFEPVKNSGKSSKTESANAEIVINSNDKGLRMTTFVHELQVYYNVEKNIIHLHAWCWVSHKRNVKYRVKLVINKGGTPKMQTAKCDRQCSTSNSWCCCHLMALIWKLENMMKNSELQNSTPDNRCCPSKPRQWGKGKLKTGRIPPRFLWPQTV